MAFNHFLIRYRRTIAQAALLVYVLNPLLVIAQVIVNAGTANDGKVFRTLRTTTQSTSIHQEDVQGVQLTSGGNTQVKALGDLTAESLQLRAGGDAALGAAGAVAITSGQAYSSTQTGSDVRQSLQTDRSVIDAVGKVIIYGQQAVQLSATTVDAGGKALVQSQGDIELGYNTDTEQHNWTTSSTDRSWYGKKTTTTTQHETVDKAAEVTKINASEVQVLGNNITSLGADITGQNLVQVEGVGKTALYAVNEEHLTKADSKSSSSWIGITYSKSSSSDSNLNTTALGTQLTSEEAIKLGVGTVTDVRGVIMTAPKIDIVRSEGADTSKDGELILGVSTNTTESSHTEKTTTLGLWQAQSGQGSTTQTANQTVINGKLNIGEGINTTVQIPEGNLKDQIAALSQQPGLGYLKDLASNPNIKWEQVKLAHDEWSYSQQGLTPAGAALLSIAVAVASGGAAAGFVNSLGFTGATAAGMTAGMTAMASSAAVSFVNNGGDIGKTLKDLGSKDSVKNIALAMVTAGVLSELGSSYQIDGKNLNDIKVADGFQANLGKAVINNLANAGVTSALTGTSLEDNIKTGLVSAFISAGAGSAAFEIGNQTQDSQVLKALAHALAGCMAGGAAGGKQGCESGAIGAVVGELAAQWYDPNGTKPPKDTLDFVKVISAAAGAITGDGSAASVSTAVMTGVNAAQNNWLGHAQAKRLGELRDLQLMGKCDSACTNEINQLQALDESRNRQLAACQGATTPACQSAVNEVRNAAAEYIRLNANGQTFTYANEKQETIALAQKTLNGYTVWNIVKGGASSIADGVSAMASAGYTGFKAMFGDEQAQAQGKQMLGAAWDFVKDPSNWPQLMGAMSPAQREQLANAYATGDGQTVAKIMGESLTNLPTGGGMGTIKKVTGVTSKLDDAAALLKRTDVDKVVEVPSGSKGNWDPTINTGTTGNLTPKTAYMLDNGHTYITDDAGRVKAVEGTLSLNKMDRNGYQQVCSGQSGCVGDDGGHLIASSLGGAGDRVNMVPQASTLNRGDWKAMERELAGYLKEGKTVSVKIDVGYPASGGVRPNSFEVSINVNGKSMVREFEQ